jgi:hypothetical protein
MPEQIFDQDRPRSAMARRLDEAFAGCEEWTLAPASPRSADAIDIAPWLSQPESDRAEDRLPRAA